MSKRFSWVPAFAGMTHEGVDDGTEKALVSQ